MESTRRKRLALSAFVICGAVQVSLAQDRERLALEIEGAAVWQSRNDVQIPNETGTRFSLIDAIGKGPYAAFRVEAAFDVTDRHGFRVIAAPLSFEDTGFLGEQVFFAGGTFDSGVATLANYKFSSYRFTYRYRLYSGATWRWKIGFTGFIRDARIALRQGDTITEDTDVGFVPLAHLRGEARLSSSWSFLLDFEGLGASQGRAFDIAAKLGYRVTDRWGLGFGYRTIEGGADVESVYNFAWLHFVVGSLRYNF